MTDTPPPRPPEDEDRTAAWPTPPGGGSTSAGGAGDTSPQPVSGWPPDSPAGSSPGPYGADPDEPRYGQRLPGYGSGAGPSPEAGSPYGTGQYGQSYPQGGQYGQYGQQYPQGGQYGQSYPHGGQYGQQYPQGGQYGQPYPHVGQGFDHGSYGGYSGSQPPAGRGLAIGSLILGLLSILTFCLPFASVLLGLAALALGAWAIGRIRQGRARGRGMAVTGITTGVIGLVLGVIVGMMWISMRPYFDDLMRCAEEPQANQQQCIQRVIDRWAAQR